MPGTFSELCYGVANRKTACVRSVLFIGVAIAALVLGGCKRHRAESTREAINGAFGWALGARLPAAFDVQTNSGALRYIDPRGNVPPFDRVTLDLTTNRTIWAVTGLLASRSADACQSLQKSLNASLQQKYPLQKQTSDKGVTRLHYGEAGREVILAMTAQPPTLALCYRDTDIARQAQQEIAASTPARAVAGAGK
jgi:hypothetical protein